MKLHKIQYYLERGDPKFDPKIAQVLLTYKEVKMIRTSDPKAKEAPYVAVLSYEKTWRRSLLAAIDYISSNNFGSLLSLKRR